MTVQLQVTPLQLWVKPSGIFQCPYLQAKLLYRSVMLLATSARFCYIVPNISSLFIPIFKIIPFHVPLGNGSFNFFDQQRNSLRMSSLKWRKCCTGSKFVKLGEVERETFQEYRKKEVSSCIWSEGTVVGGADSQVKCTLIKDLIEEGESTSVGGYWLAQPGPLCLSGSCYMSILKTNHIFRVPPKFYPKPIWMLSMESYLSTENGNNFKALICGKGYYTTGRMGIFVTMPLSLLIPGIRSGPEFLAASYVVKHHPAEQSFDQSHRNTGRIKWASKIFFTLSRGQKISSHPKTFPKIAENWQTGSFSPIHLIISSYIAKLAVPKTWHIQECGEISTSLQCKSPHKYSKTADNLNKTLKATQKMSDGYECSWEQNITMKKIVTFMRVSHKSVRLSVTFTMTKCHDTTWWSQAMKWSSHCSQHVRPIVSFIMD